MDRTIDSIRHRYETSGRAKAIMTEIPRLIWTLWLQGWETAPPIVRACRATWENRNPGWEVRALTQESLGEYRSVVPPIWPGIPRAAYSDLVRVNLLSRFGGVWADATVYCTRPLAGWIDDATSSGFFAFRPAQPRMLSTWFLAARQDSYLLRAWADLANQYWVDRTALGEYFWLHQLFADACSGDMQIRRCWDAVPHMPAGGPHLFVPQEIRLSWPLEDSTRARLLGAVDPVYKLSHRGPQEYPAGSVGDFLVRWAGTGRIRPTP
jgi:hypothetical protein